MKGETKILIGILIFVAIAFISVDVSFGECNKEASDWGCGYSICAKTHTGNCPNQYVEDSGPMFVYFGFTSYCDSPPPSSSNKACCDSFCKSFVWMYDIIEAKIPLSVQNNELLGYPELYYYINGTNDTSEISGNLFADFNWSDNQNYHCYCYMSNSTTNYYIPNGKPALYYNNSGLLIPLNGTVYATVDRSQTLNSSDECESYIFGWDTYYENLDNMNYNNGLCESGYVSQDGYCCNEPCTGTCIMDDGTIGNHSCKKDDYGNAGYCHCVPLSGLFNYGNWTMTVDFGKEVNLTEIEFESLYTDCSGMGPLSYNVSTTAPNVSYKKPSDNVWSSSTNTSPIILNSNGNYTAQKLNITVDFNASEDCYGNPTTPVLRSIKIHTKPRLHGVQGFFEGQCWPLQETITYTTGLAHVNNSCTQTNQLCGNEPCLLAYEFLNSTKYDENNHLNDFSAASTNFCWKGCQ